MNTKELDQDLDYFRDRIVQLANGGTLSEQMKNSLSGVADKLAAAQDDQVPDVLKATVLSPAARREVFEKIKHLSGPVRSPKEPSLKNDTWATRQPASAPGGRNTAIGKLSPYLLRI